jgi:hypothetical protein
MAYVEHVAKTLYLQRPNVKVVAINTRSIKKLEIQDVKMLVCAANAGNPNLPVEKHNANHVWTDTIRQENS